MFVQKKQTESCNTNLMKLTSIKSCKSLNAVCNGKTSCILVMQEASDAHSKTADSDTVSTYQVSSVQLVTDKKLEAFNKA